MVNQGVHAFLEEHVFQNHFAGSDCSGDQHSGALRNAKAIAKGRAVDHGLKQHVDWARRRGPAPQTKEPYVKRLVRQFAHWGWRLLESQLPVLVRDWSLLTRLDLVVFDTRLRKLMVVEIKTGYEGRFTKPHGTFRSPFKHVPNSPVNQARAQAVLSLAMTRRDGRYDPRTPLQGIHVVWCTADRISRFGAEEWCVDFLAKITEFLDTAGPMRRIPPEPRSKPKKRPCGDAVDTPNACTERTDSGGVSRKPPCPERPAKRRQKR